MTLFRKTHFSALALLFSCVCCFASQPPQLGQWRILEQQAYDPLIFTQGYLIHEGNFYISSGGFGRSYLSVHSQTNQELHRVEIPDALFAEGLSLHAGHLYLLTWKSGKVLRFTPQLQLVDEKRIQGEGWGLTSDGTHLINSNGSANLFYRDPGTLHVVKQLKVQFRGQALAQLNELEWAEGYIWANVWRDNHIYKIDPKTGEAIARWDLSSLRAQQPTSNREAVVNGIAWDKNKKAFWVTGKLWHERFLIQLEE